MLTSVKSHWKKEQDRLPGCMCTSFPERDAFWERENREIHRAVRDEL